MLHEEGISTYVVELHVACVKQASIESTKRYKEERRKAGKDGGLGQT